jgi:hypothetical protein
MVALVAPLPDAVVGDPIGPGHVVHQVLDEIALIAGLHDHQAGAGELGELQQKEGGGIELEVAPAVVRHHRIAAGGVELGVDRVEAVQAGLEALHLGGLAQHGRKQAAHQLQHPLFELEGAAAGAPQAAIGQGETPDALNRIHAVAHPGIAVVAVHGVGGTGRQQAAQRMLALQNHRLDLAVEILEAVPGGGGAQGLRGRARGRRGRRTWIGGRDGRTGEAGDGLAKEALGNKVVKRSLRSDLFLLNVLGAD